METFRFQPGETPVLLSIPHVGTALPADVAAGLTDEAAALPDTDWHLDRLYHFAPALGVGFLTATHSRYVVDLNRDPEGTILYPGVDNTEICPTRTFDMQPVHKEGAAPDAAEIQRRIELYWRPYHDQLARELTALRERFGIAVLLDAHSIRSRVPRFFDGALQDFCLGTADGASASPALVGRLMNVVTATEAHSHVLNGRFKGGHITRRFGRPQDGIHSVQLEMSQATYMEEEPPYRFRPDHAAKVRPVIERLLGAVVEWAWENASTRRRSVF